MTPDKKFNTGVEQVAALEKMACPSCSTPNMVVDKIAVAYLRCTNPTCQHGIEVKR